MTRVLDAALAIGIAAAAGAAAHAQSYPAKPIRFLVGFAAGGATDVSARMLAQRLTESLGQAVIVENRAGSGGLIATEAVSRAPADGYTLLMMPAADAVQPALRRKLPYNLERDFTPVGRVVTGPWVVVVHPNVPARTIRDLVGLAKRSPGKLNYATSGIGSSAHIANELFNSLAGVKTVHVPYKGVSEGVTATAAGQTDMIFASITAAKPLLDAAKVRPLAISTIKRTRLMPSMPTVDESGVPGYDRSGWYGVLAPAGVAREVVTKLNAAIAAVVNTPAMTEAFNNQGLEPGVMGPEEFGAFIRREVAQNIKVVKDAGIQVE
ncbi:MAG: tripartite tricarboxylate transporter substrate binding protein [Burkholderiales bacterium]|nr:tripartite tricarboxylate transporter substrate binding protein [Burkholderiales bacterium]